mmetsp:Transcript_20246/g.26206  ORF Transcript_20246/g.26206 Transcript_20246/m.26206 type:complete len:197 (-) Transcript_20246:593-1183(-)
MKLTIGSLILLGVVKSLQFHPIRVHDVSRSDVLKGFLASSAVIAFPQQSVAYQGVYGMEIVTAKDAVLDDEAMGSKEVKTALTNFRKMYSSVKELKQSVASNDQYDVTAVIRKDFDPTFVRDTFNNLNPAFDKDTQKGTDRLQRAIIQDLLEVETAGKLSSGKPRSEKKIALVTDKLNKLEEGFGKLDAYFASASS